MRIPIFALLAFILLPVCAHAVHQVDYTGEFPQTKPVDVAVDEDNKLYIIDENGFVYVKTEAGELVRSWGNADPLGAWKLKRPGGIAVQGDKVYVTDAGTGYVLIFNKEGALTGKFQSHGSSPEMYNLPSGIDVFGGVIYVADSVNKKIQIFGPDGIFKKNILIRDCSTFTGLDGRYMRTSVRTRDENLRLFEELRARLELNKD